MTLQPSRYLDTLSTLLGDLATRIGTSLWVASGRISVSFPCLGELIDRESFLTHTSMMPSISKIIGG